MLIFMYCINYVCYGSLYHIILQGVCLGSGIGSFEDVYDTSIAYEKGVSLLLSFLHFTDNDLKED